jgi:thiosulfate/3-mercaptopyruvate sulfurtransferase
MKRLLAIYFVFAVAGLSLIGSARADTVADNAIISATAAKALVGKAGVVFLHIGRDNEAFDAGHIQGARFLPLDAFTVERNGVPFELPPEDQLKQVFGSFGIDRDTRVVIYSDPALGDIDVLAAARAFFSLEAIGHRNVAVIDGGLDAWRAAEFDLTTGPSVHEVRRLDPRPRQAAAIVTADDVAARLEDAALFLVDARPPAEYSGAESGTDVDRPGHIPGAHNLFWKDFLNEDGTLKPVEDLAEIWTDAGVTRHHDVVVYCRTGMQASYAYLVARHLGMTPQMYDASYIDWSNNTSYPVVRTSTDQ